MRSKHFTIIISVAAILIIAFALASGTQFIDRMSKKDLSGKNISRFIKPEFPDFVYKTVRVEDAYTFAVNNQDKVMYLSCYCGCAGMQHTDNLIQHRSLEDCYLKPDGSYEPHAAECKLCNDITLEAKDLLMKGISLKEVRKTIDDKYPGRGVGTNTSLPP
jgi:hypothetical protein